MGNFKDLEDLGLKTSVSVLGIRPGPRSELKTLDRLLPAEPCTLVVKGMGMGCMLHSYFLYLRES